MAIISIFYGNYCNEEPIIRGIINKLNYKHLIDEDIVVKASKISNIQESKIKKAFSSKISIFNQFSHEKEKAISFLKLATAETLIEHKDYITISGFSSMLIPSKIKHVLRVCLIADMKFRVSIARSTLNISENDALKLLRKDDEDKSAWVNYILGKKDPWDSSIYDMLLPTDKMKDNEIINLIYETVNKDLFKSSVETDKLIEDFHFACQIETILIKHGHIINVEVDSGNVTLTINKHVLMLKRLEDELKSIVTKIQGVKSVTVKVGEKFYQADVYRKFDLEMPSKLLLVDDERQFVQTLSERLSMRDIGSLIAYDGESALSIIKEEEPEVIILDLKMPGIDGIEVLRRVKKTNPDVEVIILTGHGSEADKKLCMELGAFAYLEKPVDVNLLSEMIKKANENIKKKKASKN